METIKFAEPKMHKIVLESEKFDGNLIDLSKYNTERVEFINCLVNNCFIKASKNQQVYFEKCLLMTTTFKEAEYFKMSFVQCNYHYIKFDKVITKNFEMWGGENTYADTIVFEGCFLKHIRIENCDLKNIKIKYTQFGQWDSDYDFTRKDLLKHFIDSDFDIIRKCSVRNISIEKSVFKRVLIEIIGEYLLPYDGKFNEWLINNTLFVNCLICNVIPSPKGYSYDNLFIKCYSDLQQLYNREQNLRFYAEDSYYLPIIKPYTTDIYGNLKSKRIKSKKDKDIEFINYEYSVGTGNLKRTITYRCREKYYIVNGNDGNTYAKVNTESD